MEESLSEVDSISVIEKFWALALVTATWIGKKTNRGLSFSTGCLQHVVSYAAGKKPLI